VKPDDPEIFFQIDWSHGSGADWWYGRYYWEPEVLRVHAVKVARNDLRRPISEFTPIREQLEIPRERVYAVRVSNVEPRRDE
jgi:hypothetical protein